MQGEIQGTPAAQVSSNARIASLAVQNVLRGVKHRSTAFCVVRWKRPRTHSFIHAARTPCAHARTRAAKHSTARTLRARARRKSCMSGRFRPSRHRSRRVRDRAAAVSRLMTDASPRAPESAEAAAAPESVDGKRRSRWGAKTEDAPGNSEAPAPARKRSRWGSKPAQSTDPVTLAVQLGIPLATLQQMTAEQQQMLPVIKSKIDEVDLQ